jgi:mono/diheme cytochrome c family protein
MTGIGILVGVSAFGVRLEGQEEEKEAEPQERHVVESLDGRTLFRAYCAVCHGLDARGKGPAAPALKKEVPDLTLISFRNGGKFPLLRVQQVISGEEIPAEAHGSREMPIWGPIFSQVTWDQDLGKVRIYNLAKYIETLQRKQQ